MPPEKLILISDVHSNLHALEAVKTDIARRGLSGAPLCFLGDAVDMGPFPAEAVDLLRSMSPAFRVRGNHDRYVSMDSPRAELERYFRCPEGADHSEWTSAALTAGAKEWLGSAPLAASLDLGGVRFRVFHASEDCDEHPLDQEAASGNILCGHIHSPYVRAGSGGTLVINPGSVGSSLDGNPAASYALLT
ncbi:MAG: metallophosphoesterase family protein, partial [Elusimicrobia bacterium]|nr:metallophosphoesterase family protein [Elusimicrobiota bacterium]